MTTTKKAIRLGKELRYELLLMFDRFKGFTIKEIHTKLVLINKPISINSLYKWHRRYSRANRKVNELTKGW